MSKNFKRNLPLWLVAAGVVMLIAAAGVWCYNLYNNPEKAFWNMLSQSLSTSGVSIQAVQSNNGATVRQTTHYSLGAENISHTRTVISQNTTRVVTEIIATPKTDYTRYESIKTQNKGKDGKPLDVSKLVGVWAKDDAGQLFSQAALGLGMPIGGIVVPIANPSPKLRNEMLDQIRADNVYQTDFSKAQSQKVNGRKQFTYEVKINPVAYARLMKMFAKNIGLNDLDTLDPSAYKGQPPLDLQITIDAKSGHTVRVNLPQSKYQQTYSSYDVPVRVTLPTKTITSQELNKRLSEVR